MGKRNIFKLLSLSVLSIGIISVINIKSSYANQSDTTLTINCVCRDYSDCINLDNMILKLNDKEYEPLNINGTEVKFEVPGGTANYEILLDSIHTCGNLKGTLFIENATNTTLNVETYGESHGIVSVKAFKEDIDSSIVPVDMTGYSLDCIISNYRNEDKVLKVQDGKIELPKDLPHGKYIIKIPEFNNIKEINEPIIYNGNDITVDADYISVPIIFKIKNLKDIKTSGVKATITNITTNKTKELNFENSSDSFVKAPCDKYKLVVTNHGIFDNTNYSKDILITKETKDIELELTRNTTTLNINVTLENGKPLSNSKFKIEGDNITTEVQTTDSDGLIKLTGLVQGNYNITQLDTGNYNIQKSDIVSLQIGSEKEQTIEIVNKFRLTVPTSIIPKIDDTVFSKDVSLHIKGLSTSNSYINKEIITNGKSPCTLDLPQGLYSIVCNDLEFFTPNEHTILTTIVIDDKTPKSIELNVNYSPKVNDNIIKDIIPFTGKVGYTILTLCLVLVFIISSGVFIYRFKIHRGGK